MKRDRADDDEEQIPKKLHKADAVEGNDEDEMMNDLINDPTFREDGSYLVITEDSNGQDIVEYHICTTDNAISVHDAHGRLLKVFHR